MTIVDDCSSDNSCSFATLTNALPKNIPSAANSAFPLCCKQQSNTCKLWSFFPAGLTRWCLRIPPFGVLPYLLSGSLQIFPICSESTLSPDKYFGAHSGHILLPGSQWGQELLQSVHTKLSCKLSVAHFITVCSLDLSALVRQASPVKVGNWYRKINALDF